MAVMPFPLLPPALILCTQCCCFCCCWCVHLILPSPVLLPLQAFKNLDYGQFKLVFEALHERNVLLQNVPYLSNPLPIMTVSAALRWSVKQAVDCQCHIARVLPEPL